MSLLLALLACTAPRATDRTPEVPETGALLLATTDFEVGTVALYEPAGDTLSLDLALTGGDPQVRAVGGLAAVIDRFTGDGLRLYDPTDWTRPLASVPIDGAANIHDLAAWGELIVASQYERPELLLFDESGLIRGTVDLSPWADRDGIPEASGLWSTDRGLVVALQRLDRDAGWTDGGGRLLRVDPETAEVEVLAEIGPSPRLSDGGAVLTGLYFQPDGALLRTTEDGELSAPVLQESAHDFSTYAEVDGHGVLTGVSLSGGDETQAWCVDWSGPTIVEGPSWSGLWASAASDGPSGGVWLALRSGWAGSSADPAFVRIDPETCLETDRLHTPLEPYDVARL